MTYEITIKQIEPLPPEEQKSGYRNEKETEVFRQRVEQLRLAEIIKAINGMPNA